MVKRKSIYTTDDERVHTYEQSVTAYKLVCAAYLNTNYEILEIPKASVEKRDGACKTITLFVLLAL